MTNLQKVVLFSAVAAVLGGCGRQPSADAARLQRQSDTTLTNPADRFQMMPSPSGRGFLLLDTRMGIVRSCDDASSQIACGSPASVAN